MYLNHRVERLFSQARNNKPRRVLYFIVPNRNKETLEELIDLFVVLGSTIHSDEFKRCCGLKEKGYDHKTVRHVDRFSRFEFDGTTATRITTNHIERSWVDLHRSLRHQSGDEMGSF